MILIEETAWKSSPPPKRPRPNGNKPNRLEIPKFTVSRIGLGGRYNLLFSDKIKPYFGASWNVQLPNLFKIDYHFDDQSKDDETQSQDKITHLIGLNSGVNVLLSSRLSLNGEVYYQTPISKEDNIDNLVGTPNVLGGRVGVSYRFGK